METSIITLEQALDLSDEKAIEFFTNQENIDSLVHQVRVAAIGVCFDPKTKAGREGIGSIASKVSKSKTTIISAMDNAAAKQKAILQKMQDAKKSIESQFKEIRNDVLKPRNDWQNEQDRIELERVTDIKNRIENLRKLGEFTEDDTAEQLASKIDILNGIDTSNGFQEFYWDANEEVKNQVSRLHSQIVNVAQAEQRRSEEKNSSIEKDINKIKQYPVNYIGANSREIKAAKQDLDREYQEPQGEGVANALMLTNEILDKMIESAEKLEPLSPTVQVTDTLIPQIQEGEPTLFRYEYLVTTEEKTVVNTLVPIFTNNLESAKKIMDEILISGDLPSGAERSIKSESSNILDVSSIHQGEEGV